jgi:beta-RFAP synthase
MIVVEAPSRLHFGLLSLGGNTSESACWPAPLVDPGDPGDLDQVTVPARRFGSVGLMIEQPGVRLSVRPANEWRAEGPLARRALAFAERFAQAARPDSSPCAHLTVERCAREHAGLGTGTQLGLAVARALERLWSLPGLDAKALAECIGRGARSALGIHGLVKGGFLVDGGKRADGAIAPLVARLEFPSEWRIVLVVPTEGEGIHGPGEAAAFASLPDLDSHLRRAEVLCRLVLLGLLPALAERDLEAFGAALYEFNLCAGAGFAPIQGGPYASSRIADLVRWFRQEGISGVGQSSWGPTVFAVAADEEHAQNVRRRLCSHMSLAHSEVIITQATNHGATTSGQ